MEIHVPDHPVMTWKQFFVHMGIVVLGLLIALGLEQTVEAVHRHRERTELREAMHRDLEQISRDSLQSYNSLAGQRAWMMQNASAAEDASEAHKTFAPTRPPAFLHLELVSDPAFRSARASGLLSLLSQDEVRAYSELDSLVDANQQVYLLGLGSARMEPMLLQFGFPGNSPGNWPHASEEDLRHFVAATTNGVYMVSATMLINQQVYGAAQAILRGERDPQQIYKAETKDMPGDGAGH